MKVAIFIAVVTIAHLIGYAFFVYWCTKIKPDDDTPVGEIIGHSWDGITEINNKSPQWIVFLFYAMIVAGSIYLVLHPGVFGNKWNGLAGKTQFDDYKEEKLNFENKSNEYFAFYGSKTVEELTEIPEAIQSGRRIFLNNCAVCHGIDAQGTPGHYPNLTDNEWLWGGSPETLITTITNGRNVSPGQGMPSGGALRDTSDTALTNVANYVLSMGGYDVDSESAAAGKVLYDQSCIACHGPKGKGTPAIGAPNISNNIWLYYSGDLADVASLRAFIKHQIMHPVNNTMPSWHKKLGDARIKVVAAYVYSLSQ